MTCLILPNPVKYVKWYCIDQEGYGRRGIGIELKEAYYRQAVSNLADAEAIDEQEQLNLFSGGDE